MVDAMTIARPTISLPLHGALELLTGLTALVAPFALGFGPAGAVVSVLVAVCTIGLALDAAQEPQRVSTHHTFDYGVALGAVTAAIPLALAGEARAALFLGALGLIQLALNGATRYSVRT
jgi:hypothetical protein